ncbi:MAG: methylamine utilization protein, partial [Ectothiorhodospiraceae bacterium]|nr:methylamine utilization protein [Ectothiorhodospiraceae bacterium]
MVTALFSGVIRTGLVLLSGLVLALSGMTARAAQLLVHVQDAEGQPVESAAILVRALDQPREPPSGREEIVDQVDREFVPAAIVVPVNTRILFPNNDDIRHHVYSFSEAKSFELPLYTGRPARPIEFPNPGIVA